MNLQGTRKSGPGPPVQLCSLISSNQQTEHHRIKPRTNQNTNHFFIHLYFPLRSQISFAAQLEHASSTQKGLTFKPNVRHQS